jgi:hypothetical protein
MKASRYFAIILAAAPLWAGVRIKVDVTDLKTSKTTQQETQPFHRELLHGLMLRSRSLQDSAQGRPAFR